MSLTESSSELAANAEKPKLDAVPLRDRTWN